MSDMHGDTTYDWCVPCEGGDASIGDTLAAAQAEARQRQGARRVSQRRQRAVAHAQVPVQADLEAE